MNGQIQVEPWLASLLSDIYQARPTLGIGVWANENVFVPASVSPEYPGFYDVRRSPLVDIMFDFYESADWDEFFLPKSSQAGASQAAHVVSFFDAVFQGRNQVITLDSTPEARRISQTRYQPLLRNCEVLRNKIDGDLSNLTIMLGGVAVFFTGAHSPTEVANKTIGLVIADEVDNYPESIRGESNAIDLLRDRVKKVMGSKLIAFSKPKFEGTLIWPEFLTGSRHKCFVPCPSCGHYQELVWGQIDFSHCQNATSTGYDYERILEETVYLCNNQQKRKSGKPLCGNRISEDQKTLMVENKEWRPTNFGQDDHKPVPRKMSAHISDIYSLFPKDTWGHLAVEWVAAQGSASKVMAHKRGREGLPWIEEKVEVSASDILSMCGTYRRGQIPVIPDVVLMGVDVQKHFKKWVKCGFLLDGTCYVIDWGEYREFADLLKEADKPVEVIGHPELRPVVYRGLIDEGGGNKSIVQDFVISTFLPDSTARRGGIPDYRFFSCYGRGGAAVQSWRDIYEIKAAMHDGYPIEVTKFNDSAFKQILYEERFARFWEIAEAKRRGSSPPDVLRVWFPSQLPNYFVSEITQEARIYDHKKKEYIWRDPPDANDFGDGLKMAFVGQYILSPMLLAKAAQADAMDEG